MMCFEMEDVRGKKEEFFDGRCKREEGRILRWKMEDVRRKKEEAAEVRR